MPFFIIKFTEPLGNFALSQNPNGTPLSIAQPIHTPCITSVTRRVYWIDDTDATPEYVASVRSMDGVVAFHELRTAYTIYDREWKWEDKQINSIIVPAVWEFEAQDVIGPLDPPTSRKQE